VFRLQTNKAHEVGLGLLRLFCMVMIESKRESINRRNQVGGQPMV